MSIRVSHSALSFGEVWRRKEKTLPLTLENRSYHRIAVQIVAPSGFSASPATIVLDGDCDFIAHTVAAGQIASLRRASRVDREIADMLAAGSPFARRLYHVYATGNE